MTDQKRSRHIPKEVASQLLEAQRYRCCVRSPVCAGVLLDPSNYSPDALAETLDKHHIEMFSKGGEHTYDNLLLACDNCHEKYGHEYIEARFASADCQACPHLSNCTRSKRGVRTVTFKPQVEYETLQAARERQETEAFKQKYQKRAGVEGTISQGTRTFDLRRSRYLGLAKTHLQHLATAAAMNLTRAVSWLEEEGRPKTSPYCPPFAALAPT